MLALDKETFETEVIQGEGLILVDYWSESCVPCKALMPDVEALSQQFEGRVKFCKLDVTTARRLAISQKVLGLPTITIYRDGVKVGEVTKEDAGKAGILMMIEKAMG